MEAIIKSFKPKNKRDLDLLLAIAQDERNDLKVRLLALRGRINSENPERLAK
jgi:hypothetical protein